MNSSTYQLARMNLYAAVTGITDRDTVEIALKNPEINRLLDERLVDIFDGPFGIIEDTDGYLEALEDLSTIDIEPIGGSEEFREGVAFANRALLQFIGDLITELKDEDEEEAELSGADALADLFTQSFGRPVTVVQA